MTLKEKIIQELGKGNYKIRYYKQSPFQKARYKPEFVEEECWVYTNRSQYGYCITATDFEHKEYIDTIKQEIV